MIQQKFFLQVTRVSCFMFLLTTPVTGSSAADRYSVCVGDGENHACAVGHDDFKFNCDWAHQHPTHTDDDAASAICRGTFNYSTYKVYRNGVYGGGNCGAIKLFVDCE